MREEEARIIQLLQARRQEGLSEFYDRYADAMYGIVLRIVKREAVAEDVMQEAFMKIWNNSHRYDSRKGSLFTWGLNIARNTAIDKIRSKASQREKQTVTIEASQIHANGDHTYAPNIQTIGLKSLVNNLEIKYQEIIDLVYFQGFTQQEIHKKLDIPLGTVKSRLRIGLRELRKHFTDHSLLWVPWLLLLM
jgi:RNA polymerase sigma-70 factor (ECF subfamily)